MTEEQLIQLFRRYNEPLYRFALKRLNDPGEAQDIVSEAWIKVLKGDIYDAGYFFENMCHFVRHRIADRLKHLQRARRIQAENAPELSAEPVYPEYIAKNIQLLPVGQRVVARMVFIEQYTPKECAAALKITVDTVRVQMMKARRYLRVFLQ